MELIQFSTLTCGPCRQAREYIGRNYDPNLLNYTYIPLEYLNDFDDKYATIVKALQVRAVPLFVVINEDNEVVYTFRGFDKEKIDQYARYVYNIKTNKIKECLPEELENKIDDTYNKLLGDINKHQSNGKGTPEDLDFLDLFDNELDDLDE